MSPSNTLRIVGESLYGTRWQSDLAVDLGISDRTMRRWVAGTDVPRFDVVMDLQRLLVRQQQRIQEAIDTLPSTSPQLWRTMGTKVPQEPALS